MNIEKISEYGEEYMQPLRTLYQHTGNCVVNGFLGEALKKISFDEEGRLGFTTSKEYFHSIINTEGVVLSNSVLLKQVAKDRDTSAYRLYSWDLGESMYTYLSFDNQEALNHFYDVIKRMDVNLCDDDISTLFQEMGLTFDSVVQVLLNQRYHFSRIDEENVNKTPYGI